MSVRELDKTVDKDRSSRSREGQEEEPVICMTTTHKFKETNIIRIRTSFYLHDGLNIACFVQIINKYSLC